jgi:hypothetical protein
MNAEIEHASPWGKAPGEKVPGQRKKIGAAAGAPTTKAHRESGCSIGSVLRRTKAGSRAAHCVRWLPSRRLKPRDSSDDTPNVPQR